MRNWQVELNDMNLLDYDQIWRVLLIGLFAGITLIGGFAISYIGNMKYISFLQLFIRKLESLLVDISGRTTPHKSRK